MPTTLTNGIQLPDKGSVDWYSSMQSNYNLIDTHLGDTDAHVTAEDKANWNSKQGSLSQAQLDAIAQVATNTDDIASLQSGKANASHTHSSNDITDIGDYATKDYVDNSISDLVDNAPDALNTLNELSAALNDDANFASTVTTALAAKADSADLATVATSGSYDDLDDKPIINDSTITIQKNGSTVGTFTTNGSAKTIDIPVPTKTSDLTNDSNFVVSASLATVATSGFYNDLDNKPYIPDKISDLIDDSNFVDTSNPAVSSGITSAKVTDYDTHISDTDIHVTTADKNKWNNQTFVFRYSSTALTASSTNANSLLDNTDNLKVGDKVIDSNGVLFSITAIDTQNSTFTIGTALIDLANDSDVVHKSGNETVGGEKTFTNDVTVNNSSATVQADVPNLVFKNPLVERASTILEGEQTILFTDKNNSNIASIQAKTYTSGTSDIILTSYSETSDQSVRTTGIIIRRTPTTSKLQGYSDNITDLGDTNRRWRRVYAMNYYYGNDNVEFSTKFVTTDTNQTISGQKLFDYINTLSSSSEIGVSGGNRSYKVLDKNKKTISSLEGGTFSTGMSYSYWLVNNGSDVFNGVSLYQSSANLTQLRPYSPTLSLQLGSSVRSFSDCYTSKINGVEPSSLSLPSGNASNVIDISSYITALDGTSNSYTVPANGWISIAVVGTAIAIVSSSWSDSRLRESSGNVRMLYPVLKNETVSISVIGTTLAYARFIPCQGNV